MGAEQGSRLTVSRLGELLSVWEEDASLAHKARQAKTPRGPVTGLSRLDQILGGFLSPGLHVMHGQPGTGKTALALQIASECGCPALFLSCEMGRLELFRRLTARVTGTYLGRLKSGELLPAESLALAQQTVAKYPGLVLGDATLEYATPAWLQDVALATRGDHPHLLIVIDSLHSWAQGWGDAQNEYDALNQHISLVCALAQELKCPVVAVAERNRAQMGSGGMNASAGTRRFEYGAESVWDLSPPKDAVVAAPGSTQVLLTLDKNRNGSPGQQVRLSFHGALQQFTEAASNGGH